MSKAQTLSFIEHLQHCELLDEKGAQQLRSLTQKKSDSALAVASRTGMVPEPALVEAEAAGTLTPDDGMALADLHNRLMLQMRIWYNSGLDAEGSAELRALLAALHDDAEPGL